MPSWQTTILLNLRPMESTMESNNLCKGILMGSIHLKGNVFLVQITPASLILSIELLPNKLLLRHVSLSVLLSMLENRLTTRNIAILLSASGLIMERGL